MERLLGVMREMRRHDSDGGIKMVTGAPMEVGGGGRKELGLTLFQVGRFWSVWKTKEYLNQTLATFQEQEHILQGATPSQNNFIKKSKWRDVTFLKQGVNRGFNDTRQTYFCFSMLEVSLKWL